MGQKVDPRGYRVGVSKSWPCEWYAKSKVQSASFFVEDFKIRDYIEKTFKRSGIGKVVIRKTSKEGEIVIFTAKPAIFIGKDGKNLEELEKTFFKKFNKKFKLIVKEIKAPELSAKIMGEFACEQLEKRVPFRRVAKGVIQKVRAKGAIGVKISVGGRLGGVDLARSEKFLEGRIPLQTLRSDIEYHYTTAITKYGILGVKVWIYKGDIHKKVSKISKLKPNSNFKSVANSRSVAGDKASVNNKFVTNKPTSSNKLVTNKPATNKPTSSNKLVTNKPATNKSASSNKTVTKKSTKK